MQGCSLNKTLKWEFSSHLVCSISTVNSPKCSVNMCDLLGNSTSPPAPFPFSPLCEITSGPSAIHSKFTSHLACSLHNFSNIIMPTKKKNLPNFLRQTHHVAIKHSSVLYNDVHLKSREDLNSFSKSLSPDGIFLSCTLVSARHSNYLNNCGLLQKNSWLSKWAVLTSPSKNFNCCCFKGRKVTFCQQY